MSKTTCVWSHAYRSEPCGLAGYPLCKEHLGVQCANLGCTNQAMAECCHAGQFVCGYPYCSECGEHFHDPARREAIAQKRRLDALRTKAETLPVALLFRDGDKWCAVREDFVELQTSKAGFGDTQGQAVAALCNAEGRP